MLEGWDEGEIFAAATAAVREASDGAAFLRHAKSETGLDIRLLSGEDEARYGALGVLSLLWLYGRVPLPVAPGRSDGSDGGGDQAAGNQQAAEQLVGRFRALTFTD